MHKTDGGNRRNNWQEQPGELRNRVNKANINHVLIVQKMQEGERKHLVTKDNKETFQYYTISVLAFFSIDYFLLTTRIS